MKQKRQSQLKNPESGSVLIIIMVAVTLFAALSFAVSDIMSSGDPNVINNQEAGLFANEIIDYGRSLRETVRELNINNGCSSMEVSFENDFIEDYEHSPPAEERCRVFERNGGGMAYVQPRSKWLDMRDKANRTLRGQWFFPAGVCVPDLNGAENDCDTDSQENEVLIVYLPYINMKVCQNINYKLYDIEPIPAEEGQAWPGPRNKFIGRKAEGIALNQNGLQTGCFEGKGTGEPAEDTYHFFQVLALH